MNFVKYAPVFVVATALFAATAHAAPAPVTLVQSVAFPVVPDKATVVISQGEQIVAVVPAAIVVQEGVPSVMVVGRATLPIEGGPYTALFTVYSKTGEVGSATREVKDARLEPAVLLEVSELKRRLTEQKAELRKWDVQSTEQKTKLKKVQEQADTFASVSRIVDADDELRAAKDESHRLMASIALAQERQSALKSRETPPNYKKREAELSAQLNVMATNLKASQEDESLAAGSKELQEKQALVESTKYEHIDLLKDELVSLRRKREALEKNAAQEN
jgi:hypothetical protein